MKKLKFVVFLMCVNLFSIFAAEPLKFNLEPSDKKPFGITIGYISKQETGYVWGNVFRYSLFGGDKGFTPAFQFGFTYVPEFRYGIGIQTGAYVEIASEKPGRRRYLDINLSFPIRAQYRYEIIKDLSVLLYTGPSFDFGVYGASKIENENYGENWYTPNEYSSYDGFNLLWGVGAGVQYKNAQVRLGGEFGLLGDGYERYYLSKPIQLSLSYLF
ncbi:MAG TPA: hypothetical protein PLS84_03680 [Salinivirgaceae bacterium]|nr:hypothetical protein [Salinivirgaceae bacterium]